MQESMTGINMIHPLGGGFEADDPSSQAQKIAKIIKRNALHPFIYCNTIFPENLALFFDHLLSPLESPQHDN